MKHMIKIEGSLINLLFFLLGLSIFISKAGISLFCSLVIIYYLYNLKNNDFNPCYKKIKIITLISFFLALTSAIIINPTTQSISYNLQKSILLFVSIAILSVDNRENLKYSILGIIVGLIIALFYSTTLYIYSDMEISTAMVNSFWDIGRWREFLSYSVCMLIPLLTKKISFQKNILIILLLAIILFCIIISGGRAPFISITISFLIYLSFFHRKYIPHFILVFFVLASLISITSNPISNYLKEKVASISNTTDNYSNLARIQMYNISSQYILYKLKNEPDEFIFGTGEFNLQNKFKKFIDRSDTSYEEVMRLTNMQFSIKDHHNAYLNNISKRGALYTIAFYFLIFNMIKYNYKLGLKGNKYHRSAFILVLCYLITGLFYSNGFSYQLVVMLCLWSIFTRYGDLYQNSEKS